MESLHKTLSVYLALCSFVGSIRSATISVQPTNETVKIGDQASFYCGVTGVMAASDAHTYRKLTPTNSLIGLNNNPNNVTKHNITDTFRLTIFDVAISDEGMYECELFPVRQIYTMSLTVVDGPTSSKLVWDNNQQWATAGVTSNLTCSVESSRPPATFRIMRGAIDVTSQAVLNQGRVDYLGYGSSQSTLSVAVNKADVGTIYTCHVDLANMMNVTSLTLPVQISGASRMHYTLGVAASVLITLFKSL